MRTAITLLLLCLAVSARAREWRNELYHCSANIPDSAGWQMIDAPAAPGITPILVMQHAARQSVFGISIADKYREANLADPAIQKDLEAMLRQFGYQFIGHSNVKVGGLDWLQYPVRSGTGAQQASGVIRFTSAGGYVFSITMLRGGGQEAAQDPELQQAAASFRVLPASAFAPAAPASAPAQRSAKAATEKTPEDKSTADAEDSSASGNSNLRLIWIAAAGLFVLAMFFGIIGTGRSQKR